jgi:hypothetical protein
MLKNWIRRIRIRRYSRLLEEFLLHHKDCPVKEIRMVSESDIDYDRQFYGKSYLHIHCENNEQQGNFYISVDKEDEVSLWELMMTIGIRAGFSIK